MALLDRFCERRVPVHVRDQVALQFTFQGNDVVLFEKRPVFRKSGKWVDIKVARFRFDPATDTWALSCPDRDGRWQPYDVAAPSTEIQELLAEVDRDPTGVFWG